MYLKHVMVSLTSLASVNFSFEHLLPPTLLLKITFRLAIEIKAIIITLSNLITLPFFGR